VRRTNLPTKGLNTRKYARCERKCIYGCVGATLAVAQSCGRTHKCIATDSGETTSNGDDIRRPKKNNFQICEILFILKQNKFNITMFNQIILDFVREKSYNKAEIENIKSTNRDLRETIKKHPDFQSSFIAGSFINKTMVKGISDVDVYFKYIGKGNPKSALDHLKNILTNKYENAKIKQDNPSLLVEFRRIPYNINPYIEIEGKKNMPDKKLERWENTGLGKNDEKLQKLKSKNPQFVDLIKVLKVWNAKYQKMDNYKIEENVCSLFLNGNLKFEGLAKGMLLFLKNKNYKIKDLKDLMKMDIKETNKLKKAWNNYVS